jgi:hypothetical protein
MADSTSTNDLTYTPTTWADGADGGTAITAARLNNIEQGINSASKQVNANTKSIKTLGDSVSQVQAIGVNKIKIGILSTGRLVISFHLEDGSSYNLMCSSTELWLDHYDSSGTGTTLWEIVPSK